jgi:hypothetical protein
MVESVRVSWGCALIVLSLAFSPACGGGDDDDSTAGTSGKGGSAGTTSAGGSAGSSSKEFDAGSGDSRNDVMVGGICERVATILCAGEAACCDDPGRDFAACKTAALKSCTNTYMLDVVAADELVAFDPAGASTALTMLETRASKCDPSVAAWAASSEGFAISLHGTLKDGADCEPKGGADNASLAQVLTSLASCSIADKLACMPGAMGWKCAARSSAGGKCGTDTNCADGLFCDNPSGELDGNGTCMARKAGAATCTDDTQCTSFRCTSGKCANPDDVQAAYCLD